MKIFEGLLFYEIILLILGVLFFLVLLFVLVYLVIKNRPIKAVVPLFLVSTIMMGFPGIQKITFNNGILEIEKLTEEAKKDSSDDAAKHELASRLAAIDTKRIKNPETIKMIEKAYRVIDEPEKAAIFRSKVKVNRTPLLRNRTTPTN